MFVWKKTRRRGAGSLFVLRFEKERSDNLVNIQTKQRTNYIEEFRALTSMTSAAVARQGRKAKVKQEGEQALRRRKEVPPSNPNPARVSTAAFGYYCSSKGKPGAKDCVPVSQIRVGWLKSVRGGLAAGCRQICGC